MLVMTSDARMKVHIANLTVVPASKNVRFQLSKARDAVALAAYDGALKVTDGKAEVVLTSGQMLLQGDGDDKTPPPAGTKTTGSSPV
jgi:ferric-dicitrate binding protein FerR (iron transport regulator)